MQQLARVLEVEGSHGDPAVEELVLAIHGLNAEWSAWREEVDARLAGIEERLAWVEAVAESGDGIVTAAIVDVADAVAAIREELPQLRE